MCIRDRKPVDQHLDTYGLMEGEQRGAKENCSGTMDNLLVDRMVCQDSQGGRRNLSMAWVDVRKAYDSVDHKYSLRHRKCGVRGYMHELFVSKTRTSEVRASEGF